MIIGGAGSGKSYVARHLGAALDLPVVHIDPMYYRPGWVQRPSHETRALVRAAADAPSWVFDGNNSKTLDDRAARADLIVFLDLPRYVRMAGVLARTIRSYGRTRPDMAPGCPEQIDPAFLKWVWQYAAHSRPNALAFLARWEGKVPIRHLRTRREVNAFLCAPDRVERDA